MLIVDAQIHLWQQGLPTNPAHRQVPSYSAEECLMEWTRPASARR